MLQIGSRNMHNFALLTEVGRTRKPVLLKRGMSATVAELLEKYPGNKAVREMAAQVRARAASFEARRRDLDVRLKAEQKQAAKPGLPSPFYLEDDVEYFAPGPEFRLPGIEE